MSFRRQLSNLSGLPVAAGRRARSRAFGLFALVAMCAGLATAQGQPAAAGQSPTALDCGSIPSTVLGRAVNYCVAMPADYSASASTRYPTLYFLHGLFENERRWSERGGQDVLNDLLKQEQIGEFLIVLPDGGRTFYVNSFDGGDRYEDFFIQELVPAIDAKYRTVAGRAERGISGTSMGGYGALHLAMRHPDLFGAASAHSAALVSKFPDPLPTEGRWAFYARVLRGPFGSPLNEAYWEANSPLTERPESFAGLKLYFDCGDHDRYGFDVGAEELDKVLTEKKFPHEFALRPGGHGWDYLAQYLKYSLLFHWQNFQEATPQPVRRAGAGHR